MAKKTKKLHPGGLAQNDFMAAVRRQQRGQKQNPMMPTAGMSQGRPATGRTPMPGPAPDPERMKRFEKLMREHAKRMNEMRKARIAAGPFRSAPPKGAKPIEAGMVSGELTQKARQKLYEQFRKNRQAAKKQVVRND